MLGQGQNEISVAGSGHSTLQSIDGKVLLGNADLMFNGDFSRLGDDLQITGSDGNKVFVTDYFSEINPATLISPQGAVLGGDVVSSLAGPRAPGQYVQAAAGSTSGLKQIGVVETLAGSATAKHSDGTVVKLKIGDPVFQGDVVQTATGSALGITFKDGTVFNMTASARMVLNNMVYEVGGTENAMLFSLVQGGFSFVAGKVAPTGDMKIDTPVATMGIRGTTPFVLIADNGKTTFSILPDPISNKVGTYSLFHLESGQLIGTVSDTGLKFALTTASGAPLQTAKTAADLLADNQVQQNLTVIFNKAQQNPFNEGTQSDKSNDGQKKDDQSEDGDKDGDQGAAVPGSGVTTEIVEASFDSAPVAALDEGAGKDINVEAGAVTTTEDAPEVATLEPVVAIEVEPELIPDSDPVDTSPTITLPVTPTVAEDGSTIVTGFNIQDDSSNIGVNITAQSTVTLATTVGLTFSVGDGIDDEIMSFTGSPADVTAALNGLTYNPSPDNDTGGGITIQVTDGTSISTALLTVNITAVNDVPVVTVTNPAIVSETAAGPITLDLLAQTTIVDPDTADVQSYAAGSVNVVVNGGSAAGVHAGLVSVNAASGIVTYDPADFEFLAIGEVAVFDVGFDVVSGPDTLSQTLTIEITGANTPPIITVVNPLAVQEGDTGAGSLPIIVNLLAQTNVVDSDTGDVATYVSGTANVTIAAGAATGTNLGQVNVNAATGELTYNPDDFDFLTVGESALFEVSYGVSSGPDTSTQTVTVEITGANDVATVTTVSPASVSDTAAGPVVVDLLTQTTIVDPDTSDAQSYVSGSVAVVVNASSAAGVNVSQISIDAVTGTVTYNPTDFSFLDTGEKAVFNVNFDVASGPDTSSQTLVIEITGADSVNTPPTVTVVNPAAVNEGDAGAGTPAIAVNLLAQTNIVDPDVGDVADYVAGSASVVVAATSAAGVSLGQVNLDTANGILTYNPDDFDFLAVGQSAFFDVSYNVSSGPDVSAQTLTVEVTGVNDAPTSTDNSLPTDASFSRSFTPAEFNFTDVDNEATFDHITVVTLPTNGDLTLNGLAVAAGQGISFSEISNLEYIHNFGPLGDQTSGSFQFTVSDGTASSAANTMTVSVGNVPPVVTVVDPAPVNEGDAGAGTPPVSVDLLAQTNIVDIDAGDVAGYVAGSASVAVASSSFAGSSLSQVNLDAANGVLTYNPDDFDFLPEGHSALFEVSYTVSSGPDTSAQTLIVEITGVNDAPVLNLDPNNSSGSVGTGYNDTFTEGLGPVHIGDLFESDLAISETDDTNMESLTVTLTNRLDAGAETLSYTGTLPPGVTLTAYDPGTGIISFSGTAPIGLYEELIENVVYSNTSNDPDLTERVIEVVVSDGTNDSNTAIAKISMIGVNDAPVLNLDLNNSSGSVGTGYNDTFTEGLGPVHIGDLFESDLAISETDDTNIESLTVTLTNRLDAGAETLSFTGTLPPGVTLTAYDPGTGIISFSGTAPIGLYEELIENVVYNNSSADPDLTDRVIEVVVNDGTNDSNTAIANISMIGVNDAPVINLDANNSSGSVGTGYNDTFTEGLGPVHIGDLFESDLAISETDDTNIESLTVTLTNRLDAGTETLSFTGTLPPGVTLTAYNPATGVISFSGTAPIGLYEELIENVVYNNTSDDPDLTDRVIEVVVSDGTNDSNTAIANISMIGVNDAPVVTVTDPAPVVEGNAGASTPPVTVDLFAQTTITDPDAADVGSYVSGSASVVVATGSAAGVIVGQVALDAVSGQVTYNPDDFDFLDASESAIFTATFDVQSGPDTVTRSIDIEITGQNDTPATLDNTITINEDVPHTFATADFAFSDPDTSDNFIGIKIVSLPTNGTLRLSGALVTSGQIVSVAVLSSLIFTPLADANGAAADSFQFAVFDGSVFSPAKTVTFNINPQGDVPTVITDHFEGVAGGTITGNLLTNDLNPDGGAALTISTGTFITENGNLVDVQADGTVVFTAVGNFIGSDSFVYAIKDAQGDRDTGYAEFHVNPTDNSNVTLNGTVGNDTLIGFSGGDTINGFGGDDVLVGGGTSLAIRDVFTDVDKLDGGAGNDRIYATESHSEVVGGTGNDYLLAADSADDEGIAFSLVDYRTSATGIQANFSAVTQVVGGTLLNPNEVSDGLGGTDYVKGFSRLIDSNNNDTIIIDRMVSEVSDVFLSGGDDSVTFTNLGTDSEAGINYSFSNSVDGTVGVHANLSTGTATGITSANVLAANPFISAGSAPAVNGAIGNDTFSTNVYLLTGSEFDDQLIGNSADNEFSGLGGNDFISGGDGNDSVVYLFAAGGVNVDLSLNTASDDGDGASDSFVSIENIIGSLNDDFIVGDSQANKLIGLTGDDNISGGGGNDIIQGGFDNPDVFDGNDILAGEAGDDVIFGGTGDDTLLGDDGNDVLDGGKGNDYLDGGAGDDTLNSGGTPQDVLSNFEGNGDRLFGGIGNDTLISNGGFSVLTGGAGNDTLIDVSTGTNFDWANVSYKTSPGNVIANLSATARTVAGTSLGAFEVADGFGFVDTAQAFHVFRDSNNDDTIYVDETYLSSFSNPSFPFIEIRLSAGDDDVTFSGFGSGQSRISYEQAASADGVTGINLDLGLGTATGLTAGQIDVSNTLFTTSLTTNTSIGNDTFIGANYARGSKFNDQLIGSASDDGFRGSKGDDFIDGRGGIDYAAYSSSTEGIVVDLSNNIASNDGFGNQDQLLNIEDVSGSWFDDDITGDNLANRLSGGSFGDDILRGLGGDDNLRGGTGSDQLFGGAGNDTLRAGGAPDEFDAAGDFLDGGDGDDLLEGGNGFSVLRGGAGNDFLYVYNPLGNTFNDFTIADYKFSSNSVIANLTSTTQTIGGTLLGPNQIADGVGGIDTIHSTQGVHVLRDGSGDDTIIVDNTYTNSFGNWIEVRLSGGDDSVTFNGVNSARISYRSSSSADGITGVNIDLADGKATGLTAALIDPGNTLFTTSLTFNNSVGFDTFTGANRARGSQYNDQIFGTAGNEQLRGSAGDDYIDGRGGVDQIAFFGASTGIDVNLSLNTVSDDGQGGKDQVFNIENVTGNIFDDNIIGDSGNNVLQGRAGDDVLIGLDGNDQLIGDRNDPDSDGGTGGADWLEGRNGNDRLEGGAGDDVLRGGDQYDILIGGPGDDILDGGDDFYEGGFGIRSTFDQVSYEDSPERVVVDLKHGYAEDGFGTADVLLNIEVVRGSSFDDILLGGNPDNDEFEDFRPRAGNDYIDGGSGFDRVRYSDSPNGAIVNLSNTAQFGVAAGQALDGHGNTDTLINIESIVGSDYDDTLIAHDNGVQFRAANGNDTLIGGAGIDEADYGFGNPSQGITVNLAALTDQVTDTNGDIDQLTNIENVRGSLFADSITGDGNDNKFSGLAGNDILDGAGGHDVVDYQRDFAAALDYASFGAGPVPTGVNVNLGLGTATDATGDTDTLTGIEEVRGTILDDTLIGDLLDNTLVGRSGADTLTGGLGEDVFVSLEGDTGVDIITDFTAIDDEMDISSLLDAAFTPANSGDFVKATTIGGDTTFSVDADGTANGVNFVDVATLQGVGAGTVLTYIYDDADNTTTVTSV